MTHFEQLQLAGHVKQALIADNLTNSIGGGWGTAAGLGASLIPGVMAVDEGHNAIRNIGEMFAGGRTFGNRAMSGFKALGNVGMGAISLIPGAGLFAKGTGMAGKAVRAMGKPVTKLINKAPMGGSIINNPVKSTLAGTLANSKLQGAGVQAEQAAKTQAGDLASSVKQFMGNPSYGNPADIAPKRFNPTAAWGSGD